MATDEQALLARISKLEKRLKNSETVCQSTTKEIWDMEKQLLAWEEKYRLAEAKITSLENSSGNEPSDVSTAVNDDANNLVSELKAQFEASQAQLASSRAEHQQLEEKFNQLRVEYLSQAAVASLSGAESNDLFQRQLDEATSCLQVLQAALTEKISEIQNLEAEVVSLRQELATRSANPEPSGEQQQQLTNSRLELEASQFSLAASRAEVERLILELATVRRESAGTGSSADVTKLTDEVQLYRDKAEILQEKLARIQERFELADEKNQLLQEKLRSIESRSDGAGAQVTQLQEHNRKLEWELQQSRENTESLKKRIGDADKIYAAAEQRSQEAEHKIQESWQRVRDAEMRANQATVEVGKLTEKLTKMERKAQEGDLETQRLAFQDPLTGLPNNNLLNQYIDFTVKQAVRYRRIGALILIDIDRFKVFNEAMGFKAGDELLVQVSERLKTAIRETDSLGRRGEDEFVVLLSEINVNTEGMTRDVRLRSIRQHIDIVAKRIMETFTKPFQVKGQSFHVQTSIGIAICPDDGDSASAIYENADTALYFAKESGRNRYQFFSTELRKQQERKLSLDNQLRSGIDRGEFLIQYLPIIDLGKGKATLKGVEALVRWQHRLEGLVQPDYFLQMAEESGAIVQLGHWVTKQTCFHLREWLTQGMRIFASINLSKRELMQADVVDRISQELSNQGIAPDYLKIDIAEGFNTTNPDVMDKVVSEFGRRGIHVAIDDFGIGYSSLSRLNVEYTRIIKIDRSIIAGCPNDKQASTIAIAAISLANSLNMWSLAEGVENVAQARFLVKHGCSMAQGFYFSEPLAAADVSELYRSKKVWKI
jgi:diguanylate cyclase (GGDEF)-like protein